jgi:signal peptidase I
VNLQTDEYINIPLSEETPAQPDQEDSNVMAIVRELVETALLAAIIWLAVNFATARYVVEGSSMEPNLHTGEFLIVNRLSYQFHEPERGDIIVFDYPNNPSDDYVKRIIGLPGDSIRISDGVVYVNDEPLDEPYLTHNIPKFQEGQWQHIPDGEYFVLGDNRRASSDSRSWGMLEEDLIIGKAWITYWPISDWGIIPHYDLGE